MTKQAMVARAIAVTCALTGLFGVTTVAAQPPNYAPGANPPPSLAPRINVNAPGEPSIPSGDAARSAANQVQQAVQVLRRMNGNRALSALLHEAKGVFIIPNYARAALGIGGRGGAGVLLVKRNGTWADPAFFNYGGVSIGLQAGAEGGSIAFVLNNQRAVDAFTRQNNKWSLNASAGLTIVTWSGDAQASAGKGDVTVWSDTQGLYGDLAVSVTDMNFDGNETSAYYGRNLASASDVVTGRLANPHAAVLERELAQATNVSSSTRNAASAPGAGQSHPAKASATHGMSGGANPAAAAIARSSNRPATHAYGNRNDRDAAVGRSSSAANSP